MVLMAAIKDINPHKPPKIRILYDITAHGQFFSAGPRTIPR
jgi:hypothetical protein